MSSDGWEIYRNKSLYERVTRLVDLQLLKSASMLDQACRMVSESLANGTSQSEGVPFLVEKAAMDGSEWAMLFSLMTI